MTLDLLKLFYVSTVFLQCVRCEFSVDEVNNLIQLYNVNINASLTLTKSDKELLNSWAETHQVQQVNVTTKYRLQMSRHREHAFRRGDVDKKWTQCIDIYSENLKSTNHKYYEDESECLKTANGDDKEPRKAVDQIEKEIERDNYNFTLQRLMLLKLEAMGQLYIKLSSSIENLEECLKITLSGYLESARSLLTSIHRCYNGRRKENSTDLNA
ncbi:uncharacterized protein LOC135076737 [Ostrinia nubilalis]|uniref:uncharacterized protein LOC135076737 n=1 Tax=Ostrinia nubilalis TaxID=29057 RepID=UPI0030822160